MTQNTTNIRAFSKFRLLIGAAVIISFSTALYLGAQLDTVESCNIIPKTVVSKTDFWFDAAALCLWDVMGFWFITLSSSRVMAVVSSFTVFFLRGAVIGNAVKIFFINTVPSITLLLLLSYCAVTLMMMSYTFFIHSDGEAKSRLVRVASCLIVTGACAVIRLLPYMFIT